MLIYVRESEREEIMADSLSIDEQIPKHLRDYFLKEEEFQFQLAFDRNVFDTYGDCFMITPQILEWY